MWTLGLMWTVAALAADPPSVLIVTADCLRPDHLGVYGYDRGTSPYLDRFAAESVVFDEAFATGAWTSPGVVSLLLGYDPPVHGQNSRSSFYDPLAPSVLRLLKDKGWRTYGHTKEGPTYTDLGLDFDLAPFASLEELVEFRLENPTRRFVAWVHVKETHLPYHGTLYTETLFGTLGYHSPLADAARTLGVILRNPTDAWTPPPVGPDDVAMIRSLYDGGVSNLDRRLERNFEALRDAGALDNMIVVITADHGEELLEHGWLGHASTNHQAHLHDELVHIPLIIRFPGGVFSGHRSGLVQQTDVMPTLTSFLGVDTSGLEIAMQGQDLMPLVRNEVADVRSLLFAQTTGKGWTTPPEEIVRRLTMVRTATRKLIRDNRTSPPTFTAFDLNNDPGEHEDLWSTQATRFQDLVDALGAWESEQRATQGDLILQTARNHLDAMRAIPPGTDLAEEARHLAYLVQLRRTYELEPVCALCSEPWKSSMDGIDKAARADLAESLRVAR